jgi:hypothetical protein
LLLFGSQGQTPGLVIVVNGREDSSIGSGRTEIRMAHVPALDGFGHSQNDAAIFVDGHVGAGV